MTGRQTDRQTDGQINIWNERERERERDKDRERGPVRENMRCRENRIAFLSSVVLSLLPLLI